MKILIIFVIFLTTLQANIHSKTFNVSVLRDKSKNSFDADVTVKYTMSILMGEPVLKVQAKYKIGNLITLDGHPYHKHELPDEVVKKLRISELILSVPFITKNDNGLWIDIDMGSMSKVGSWSYNTPGSPSWDKWIYKGHNLGYGATSYLSKEKAVAAYKGFIKLDDMIFSQHIKKISFDLSTAIKSMPYYTVIDTEPVNASVKILNIKEKYHTGIKLKPGRYKILVEKKGYRAKVEWIELTSNKTNFLITLKKLDKKKQKPDDTVETQKNSLSDILEDTEALEHESTNVDDMFEEEITKNETISLEDMLEDTEDVKLLVGSIPRNTQNNIVEITGQVKNVSSIDNSKVTFKINGLTQTVYLNKNGSFSNKVVLFNGDNNIDVVYESLGVVKKKSFTIKSSTPPVKARFTLTWDSSDSDMDLHVYGPSGDHCYFSNRGTSNMNLDVDNTKRYGPENISVKLQQQPGKYKVYIKHYGGNSSSVTLYIYLDNRLVRTKRAHLSGKRRWHAYDLDIN